MLFQNSMTDPKLHKSSKIAWQFENRTTAPKQYDSFKIAKQLNKIARQLQNSMTAPQFHDSFNTGQLQNNTTAPKFRYVHSSRGLFPMGFASDLSGFFLLSLFLHFPTWAVKYEKHNYLLIVFNGSFWLNVIQILINLGGCHLVLPRPWFFFVCVCVCDVRKWSN